MTTASNTELEKRGMITADWAALAEVSPARQEVERDLSEPVLDNHNTDVRTEEKQLAPLFLPDVAKEFRSRWDTVQIGFVDDPRQAVRQGDELVGQVMKSLAETFSHERATLKVSWIKQTRRPRKPCALPCSVIARFLSACCLSSA
jgi:hypothetical protein